MESWPLWVQWALLILIGGAFLGASWWLALTQVRAAGAEPVTWRGKAWTFVGAFRFADWVTIALLLLFLIPLAIRTIAGT